MEQWNLSSRCGIIVIVRVRVVGFRVYGSLFWCTVWRSYLGFAWGYSGHAESARPKGAGMCL